MRREIWGVPATVAAMFLPVAGLTVLLGVPVVQTNLGDGAGTVARVARVVAGPHVDGPATGAGDAHRFFGVVRSDDGAATIPDGMVVYADAATGGWCVSQGGDVVVAAATETQTLRGVCLSASTVQLLPPDAAS